MLAGAVGHQFSSPELLRRAMAHRSWCAEHGGEESNERLEFLGDAVLGWVIADLAFRSYPELTEGKLSDLRKALVNATTLAEVAEDVGIGEALLLGRGEGLAGGRRKRSILADALEAVIGAVYLDAGVEAARRLIHRLFNERMVASERRLDRLDDKTQLQELLARRGGGALAYTITSTGPDHAKHFEAVVKVGGQVFGRGSGPSKKAAEQAAAAATIELLGGDA